MGQPHLVRNDALDRVVSVHQADGQSSGKRARRLREGIEEPQLQDNLARLLALQVEHLLAWVGAGVKPRSHHLLRIGSSSFQARFSKAKYVSPSLPGSISCQYGMFGIISVYTRST